MQIPLIYVGAAHHRS